MYVSKNLYKIIKDNNITIAFQSNPIPRYKSIRATGDKCQCFDDCFRTKVLEIYTVAIQKCIEI